ncbi:MAG: LapA family protein [Nitriliruptor sp.]|nr:MAG: LapA family protein [Nitriliruptor sp.]
MVRACVRGILPARPRPGQTSCGRRGRSSGVARGRVMSSNEPGKGQSFTEGSVTVGDRIVSIKLIIGALILVGVTFFVFQNTEDVALNWLFFGFVMPLWVLTLILFGSGILMGWALHVRRVKRRGS